MKRIIALSGFLFLLLMTVLPAGVSHAATAAVQLTGISVVLENGKTIEAKKVGDNQFSLNLVGDAAFGQQDIEKVIVKSPTAKTIAVLPQDHEEYADEWDLQFVNGEGVIDYTKFNNWMIKVFGEDGADVPFTLDLIKTFFVPNATEDYSYENHKTAYAFTGFLADQAGNESPATLTVKTEDWEQVGSNWKFRGDDGQYLTGWGLINSKWYYFGADTIMKTGWQSIGGKWYFFNPSGAMETVAVKSSGKLYVFDENGAMLSGTGWKLSDGKWYFLDKDTAKTGWVKSGNTWYYLDNATGVMKTGWASVGGKWYFLDDNGAMKTGWAFVGGKWYFLDNSGAMKTGWAKVGNQWYYLNGNGDMATGWAYVGGKWYFLDNSGAMKTGWVKDAGKWYYLDNSGAMKTGWVKVSNKWYFLYNNGQMAENTTIGTYRIGADGAWIQ